MICELFISEASLSQGLGPRNNFRTDRLKECFKRKFYYRLPQYIHEHEDHKIQFLIHSVRIWMIEIG